MVPKKMHFVSMIAYNYAHLAFVRFEYSECGGSLMITYIHIYVILYTYIYYRNYIFINYILLNLYLDVSYFESLQNVSDKTKSVGSFPVP